MLNKNEPIFDEISTEWVYIPTNESQNFIFDKFKKKSTLENLKNDPRTKKGLNEPNTTR